MYECGEIKGIRAADEGADVIVHVSKAAGETIYRKGIHDIGIYLEDGRSITALQRKKIYATLNDIAEYTGYVPEEAKAVMKYVHIARTGCKYFSLSDCSISLARDFINTLIEFCLKNGIITADPMLERTDDINSYLIMCLYYRKCAICGKPGEIHHWDAIGMGNDRRVYDDSGNRKICLCRTHHSIAHQKGREAFGEAYHVYGILYDGDNKRKKNKNTYI